MQSEKEITRVGVGILIFKKGKILISKRKRSFGAGEYATPGGHLEYMESFEDCIRREVREECGIEIKNIRFSFLANVDHYYPKHRVHVGLIADWESGDPVVLEPDKNESWEWCDLDKIPKPVFYMTRLAIDSCKSGNNYFDK